ncbi:cyclic lactone autoinducer peptide AgrD [Staphylococcus shinii]|nr:cyclic lactone autoinducer peptide [Staphylococcus shinii]MBO3066511.1 cyclic lactone autoinducer peptide [Staphylococcus shinii]OEK86101.1 accessory regulator AgrD [Staphylococcus shinii]PKI08730.1 cyclic lactone autoinducer peptide [Staphylococcus shinii]PKI11832.1 cyclic lactone autoinducer peptide [Staphylococcus shinii]QRA17562.1 cyclic lactone autoinducer peptide [Staphylococcus shinii]
MFLLDSIFKIIAKFFTVIGVASGGHVCIGFADEIEVPKEITDLYE